MANFVSVIISGNSKPLTTALAKATVNMTAFQKKVAFGFVAAGAAATAFAAVAVKAAIKDQVVMEGLERQIRASTGATHEQIKASEKYLKAAGRASAFGKTALIPGYKSLIVATKDANKAQAIMNVGLDVARARNLDVSTVMEALAKAYAGNTRGLRNLSPEMKKLIADGATFSDVLKVLGKNFGGAASGYAKTFQGRLDILGNSTAALKKQIGYALLPVVERLIPAFQAVADVMLKHPGLVTAIAVAVGVLATAFIAATAAVTAWKIAGQATILVNAALGTSFTTLQLAAGTVVAALAAGAAIYALFAGNSDKASKSTRDFSDALFETGDAQKKAVAELITSQKAFTNLANILTMSGQGKNAFQQFINEDAGALKALKIRIDGAVKAGRDLIVFNTKGQGFTIPAKDAKIYQKALEDLQTAQKDYKAEQAALSMLGLGDISKQEQEAEDRRKAAEDARVARFKALKSSLKDAKKALQDYVKSIGDAVSSSVSLSAAYNDAANQQKTASENVNKALEDRRVAYEALQAAQATGDAKAYGQALQDVAKAETAVTEAKAVKPKNYLEVFKEQIAKAKEFAGYIKQLAAAGLGKAGIAQILDLGPVAGAEVAKDLLAGTSGYTVANLKSDLADVAAAGAAAGMAMPGYAAAMTATVGGTTAAPTIIIQAGVGDPTAIGKEVANVLNSYGAKTGGVPMTVKQPKAKSKQKSSKAR